MTNANKIRQMTDDELFKFIEMIWLNGRFGLSPTYGWDKWLEKEAEK